MKVKYKIYDCFTNHFYYLFYYLCNIPDNICILQFLEMYSIFLLYENIYSNITII